MENKNTDMLPLNMEPMKLNQFMCEISLMGTEVDYKVVSGFFESSERKEVFVTINSYLWQDYEWLFIKVLKKNEEDVKSIGNICFTNLSPDGNKVKQVKYNITQVRGIFYPQYDYNDDSVVSCKVVFKYNNREITYFRNPACETKPTKNDTNSVEAQTESKLTKNAAAFLKASVDMLEDAKRRVRDKYVKYENTNETMNSVLGLINEAQKDNIRYSERMGCGKKELENAKYKEPNGWEVEKYNRWKERQEFDEYGFPIHKEKSAYPVYEFADFNTALNWFECHLIPEGTSYNTVPKYDEVDKDIENMTRSTVVVCSRQCGMTTHMLAWVLAKIATQPSTEIWYVTQCVNEIENLLTRVRRFFVLENPPCAVKIGIRLINNLSNGSKIRFVSPKQNLEDFFRGKNAPDYVIYDNMAFLDNEGLNKFITILDEKETQMGKFTKEICVSTPSKGGSIFNFIALVARNPIEIPWHEVKGSRDRKWAETFRELIGEENFEVEMCCKIGTEGEMCTGDELWAVHFEQEADDYKKKYLTELVLDDYKDDWFDDEDEDWSHGSDWIEIKDTGKNNAVPEENKFKREKFEDNYGNQFPDEYTEDCNYNTCCGHDCC